MRDHRVAAPTIERRRVVVIGGGISGLAAAWRLITYTGAGEGVGEVVVLEQRDVCGGALRLGTLGEVTLDLGAESVLARRPEAVDLIQAVGLGADLVHPATSSASIVSRGRLLPMPTGTLMGVPGDPEVLRGVLDDAEVARVAEEAHLAGSPIQDDVDVASWVSSRVGPAVVDRLVDPLLGGVYAGRAARLSLQATLPAVWDIARRGGSLLHGVAAVLGDSRSAGPAGPVFAGIRGGVGRLPETMVAALSRRGVDVRTGTTVKGLRRTPSGWRLEVVAGRGEDASSSAAGALDADAVVVAVPPAPAARLLRGCCPAAAAEYAAVESASLAVVTALVPRHVLDGLRGSGVLVPHIEGHPVKAATFSAAKWDWVDTLRPDLVPVRASLGRAGDAAVLQRDDVELADLAMHDLGAVLGRPLRPAATRVTRWGGALPQYAVGHADRVRRIRAAVADVQGLSVCGAALDGVGIAACIGAANRAVGDLLSSLRVQTGRMPV